MRRFPQLQNAVTISMSIIMPIYWSWFSNQYSNKDYCCTCGFCSLNPSSPLLQHQYPWELKQQGLKRSIRFPHGFLWLLEAMERAMRAARGTVDQWIMGWRHSFLENLAHMQVASRSLISTYPSQAGQIHRVWHEHMGDKTTMATLMVNHQEQNPSMFSPH